MEEAEKQQELLELEEEEGDKPQTDDPDLELEDFP